MNRFEALRRDVKRATSFRQLLSETHPNFLKEDRTSVAENLLCLLANDHHYGIETLLKRGCYLSAAALLRSCVEASLRSVWLLHCATQEDRLRLAADPRKSKVIPVKLARVIGDVEKKLKISGKVRENYPSTPDLNDLTHGGFKQMGNYWSLMFEEDEEMALLGAYILRCADDAILFSARLLRIRYGTPQQVREIDDAYVELVSKREMSTDSWKWK